MRNKQPDPEHWLQKVLFGSWFMDRFMAMPLWLAIPFSTGAIYLIFKETFAIPDRTQDTLYGMGFVIFIALLPVLASIYRILRAMRARKKQSRIAARNAMQSQIFERQKKK